ncbi:hypothetical protein EBU58_05060, partial [bacterium]|nr:hypothetical protein [bacterium]
NVVRVAVQAMAAVMGGTQSLHTNGFDEALSLPTEHAARLALRTQQIIGYESGITETPDPLAGSYLVESLTDEVERLTWEYIERIDEMGGAVEAIEAHFQQDEIEQSAYEYTKSIDDDERVIVGLNRFTVDNEPEPEVFPIDPALEPAQKARLAAFKADRDESAVRSGLEAVSAAARGTDNVLYPMKEALRIAKQIARGLHAAHSAGLIHRDIKPENVFLEGPSQRVVIIDFGLASDLGSDDVRLTVDGAIVGTPAYMAPERMSNQDKIDFKADIFGLGVMLYEMIASQFPFEGTSIVSMLASISRGEPRSLTECVPDVPADVANLVMRMLARDKADRPDSCEAIADEIAAIETRLATA